MYYITSRRKILFVLFDILSILCTYTTLKAFTNAEYHFFEYRHIVLILIFFTCLINIFTDEYRQVEIRGYLQEFKYVAIYAVKVLIVFCFILFLHRERYIQDLLSLQRRELIFFYLSAFVYTYIFRQVAKRAVHRRRNEQKRKAIIFTNFIHLEEIEKQISYSHEVIAYINFSLGYTTYKDKPVLHRLEEIHPFVANHQVDEIFVSSTSYAEFENVLEDLKIFGIPLSIDITAYTKQYIGDSAIKSLGNHTFITSAIRMVSLRQMMLKRLMDLVGGVVGVVIMGMVAMVIYPIVQVQSKGPLFFKQERIGQNGKSFYIYKFRSMYPDAEERKKNLLKYNEWDTNLMFKIKDDPRIFPFGRILRNWSLDELPQFINVLRGEMSLVGTRPPLPEEYRKYEMHHFKRLTVKPGITGLWQVSGRNEIKDFEKVVELDLKYIQNWSISEDIKILCKTIQVVLKREGSS